MSRLSIDWLVDWLINSLIQLVVWLITWFGFISLFSFCLLDTDEDLVNVDCEDAFEAAVSYVVPDQGGFSILRLFATFRPKASTSNGGTYSSSNGSSSVKKASSSAAAASNGAVEYASSGHGSQDRDGEYDEEEETVGRKQLTNGHRESAEQLTSAIIRHSSVTATAAGGGGILPRPRVWSRIRRTPNLWPRIRSPVRTVEAEKFLRKMGSASPVDWLINLFVYLLVDWLFD